jgi:DNA-binding transcriptional ArsR family regulator
MAQDALSIVFTALGDPTRRAILSSLALGPKPVGEIAAPFGMTEPGVIKHLKVLERAGLITIEPRKTTRTRVLQAAPLQEAFDWIAHYRSFWEPSFNQLDQLLEQLQGESNNG